MTVGEALADARTRAGLTVDEVSERTRIREKIIRDIERDDYEACGGDLFARGYVRVIAGAVGVSSSPFTFDIAMGVRRDDLTLRAALDEVITRRGDQMRRILRAYGVPLQ